MKKVLIALMLSIGLSASAWAYTLPLTLAVGPTVSGNTTYGNFGTVNITDISGGVHFDFVANTGYYFLDGRMVDANTVGGTVSAITETIGTANLTDNIQNVNGFGIFNIEIDNGNASIHENEVSFDLTGLGPGINSLNVLTPNASGFLVAAHIFADNPPAGVNTQTFYVANGNAPVPEPGTMMLLGAGFLSLAVYCKRRQNA